MINAKQLIKVCGDYFASYGYTKKPSQGLLNPVFSDTFNPCAGHAEIRELANSSRIENPVKWFTIEPIYRHLDAQKVGVSKYHLSFFEMFTHVDARQYKDSSKERTIEEILELLEELRIDKRRLHVTVFNGYNLLGKTIPPDEESKYIWEKQLGKQRVHPLKSSKNIEYKFREREQAGPRCEIFFERDGNFIEIGTTVFDNYIYEKGNFRKIPNGIYGSAVGIERLEMIINTYPTIWNISTIKPILKVVEKYSYNIGDLIFLKDELLTATDNLKSALLITAGGQERTNKTRRGQRLTSLVNNVKRALEKLNIQDCENLCSDVAQTIQQLYNGRYPFYKEIDPSNLIEYLQTTKLRE